MSYNGTGVFSINSVGQPVVTGTTISSTVFNALTADLATGLSTCMLKNGTQIVTANIPMAGFKLTGLGSGTAATNSAAYGQLAAEFISSGSVAGSATAVLDFTGLTSTYRQYMLRISGMIPATNNTTLWVLVSTDGGATYNNNGDYASVYMIAGAGAAIGSAATASASGFIVMPPQTLAPVNAEVIIDNPANATYAKFIRSQAVGQDSGSGALQITQSGGTYAGVTAISAIRVRFAGGNIGQGVAALYGIKM